MTALGSPAIEYGSSILNRTKEFIKGVPEFVVASRVSHKLLHAIAPRSRRTSQFFPVISCGVAGLILLGHAGR
jgi:hypothetical protein